MDYANKLSELKDSKKSEVGGKGHYLAILLNNNFNVPSGFIITTNAFLETLEENELLGEVKALASEIDKSNYQAKSRKAKESISSLKIPEKIKKQIQNSLKELGTDHLAIRSSAEVEDSKKASFAGRFDSFLNVEPQLEAVLPQIKKCWASLFNERAILYLERKDILQWSCIAVVVQQMIPAEAAGVTLTVHPDAQDKNKMVIESSWGLGEAVVSSKITPDRYLINKEELKIIKESLGSKKITIEAGEDRTKQVNTSKERREKLSLNDSTVIDLAKTCLQIEKLFKYPQDIEWCIQGDEIWILQSRPIINLEV